MRKIRFCLKPKIHNQKEEPAKITKSSSRLSRFPTKLQKRSKIPNGMDRNFSTLFVHVWSCNIKLVVLGHVHTYPEILFSANIVLRIRKLTRPHAAYSNRLQPSTSIRLYPEIFWFALVPSSFFGENPEMSMRIIAIWRHFFRAIATARCNQSKLVVYHSKKCLNLLNKSRKSMLIHINGPMIIKTSSQNILSISKVLIV